MDAREKNALQKTLQITIPEDLDYTGVFDGLLKEYASSWELVQVKTTNMGSMFHLTYNLTLRDAGREKEMIDKLRCRNGNLEITVSKQETAAAELTEEERTELIRKVVAKLPNVEVDCSSTLLAEYARQKKACTLVKGLRAVSDYENELQMALINRKLNPRLETMFLPSSTKYTYISSSMVKEMARYGADLSDFLPREIIEDVQRKYGQQEG